MPSAKMKVSLTLAADLVATVDRAAERSGSTRSGVVEQWLRHAAQRAAERAIDSATAAYYTALGDPARDEELAIARATSRAAKAIRYDAGAPAGRRPRRRR